MYFRRSISSVIEIQIRSAGFKQAKKHILPFFRFFLQTGFPIFIPF
ncbi:hypothetical protein MtrunA17_Chr6g0473171 [Medicago truncatula]|uniref:Uncharacterized protein n=1 Tax=Medicago truncatula TaxID=3880 RepID=A0A396HGU9_MEDTR|nr:hypothetical protein MtrunA17_Chr6g0473171 [Medicago truncatula]